MAAMSTSIHFASGATLDVAETIAQIWALAPQNLTFPAGAALTACTVQLTIANGAKVTVCLTRVEWMAPK